MSAPAAAAENDWDACSGTPANSDKNSSTWEGISTASQTPAAATPWDICSVASKATTNSGAAASAAGATDGTKKSASTKRVTASSSKFSNWVIPRSGQHPSCLHPACMGKHRGQAHAFFPADARVADPTRATEDIKMVEWQGPKRVACVFFKLNASTTDDHSTLENSTVTFLTGFHKDEKKNVVCAGTLDADCACGVWGAMRECAEQFKVEFASPEEFLDKTAFWWWQRSALCFAIDMTSFAVSDPRRNLSKLQDAVLRSLDSRGVPAREKSIIALSEMTVPLMANYATCKAAPADSSSHGELSDVAGTCITAAALTLQRVVLGETSGGIAVPRRTLSDCGAPVAVVSVGSSAEERDTKRVDFSSLRVSKARIGCWQMMWRKMTDDYANRLEAYLRVRAPGGHVPYVHRVMSVRDPQQSAGEENPHLSRRGGAANEYQ